MSYFKYLVANRLWLYLGVVALIVLFYLAGFFYPDLNHLTEGKLTAIFVGVPSLVFFIGNYFKWKQLRK